MADKLLRIISLCGIIFLPFIHAFSQVKTYEISKEIIEDSQLSASFYYFPISPVCGCRIKFINNSSGDPDIWIWNFGDGYLTAEKDPDHVYQSPGLYYVTLMIRQNDFQSTARKVVLVRSKSSNASQELVADFYYEPENPTVGMPIKFIDNSVGDVLKRVWKFGYFNISFERNPTKIYYNDGKHKVSLTIRSKTKTASISKDIEIGPPPANIIVANSCSLKDVQAAIAQANAGDTVLVPAGRATWKNNLVINKGIILKGAGIDRTVITCNYNGSGEIMRSSGYFITYEPSSPEKDEVFRLSGFTVNLNNNSKTGGLLLRNTSNYPQTKVRIDHTKWESVYTGNAIWWVYGYFWGVGDNNHLDTPGELRFYGLDTTTWANETFTLGSANNFYLEDNYIRCHAGDYFYLEAAGRLALRHNTLYCDVASSGYYPVIDVHGNQANAWSSAMGFEAYGNQIYASYGMAFAYLRAGRNAVFNNTFTQSSGSQLMKAYEEEYDSNNPPSHAPDGQPQHVSDSYIFNNYRNGSVLVTDFPYTGKQLYYSDEGCYVPTEDIHYFKHNPAFNGSSGVGVGPISQRPVSCSKEGVAWWATDENKLYRWKNGRWELYYVPYTYPHPLRTILGD